MSAPRVTSPDRRSPLALKNLACLAGALLAIGAGYAVLQSGSAPSLAAVLLVVGYCVLLPVGIAL